MLQGCQPRGARLADFVNEACIMVLIARERLEDQGLSVISPVSAFAFHRLWAFRIGSSRPSQSISLLTSQ